MLRSPPPDELLPELTAALARHGVDHAEVRQVEEEERTVVLQGGEVASLVERDDAGWAIRVLCDGGWGFAAVPAIGPEAALHAAARAVELARSGGDRLPARTGLHPQPPVQGRHSTQLRQDPLALALPRWLELLAPAAAPGCRAELTAVRTRTRLQTTAGTDIDRVTTTTRLVITASAVRRAPPAHAAAGHLPPGAGWLQGGFDELLAGRDLAEEAAAARELAAALAAAPSCPAAPAATVILDGEALAPLLLGTLARAVELDRLLGDEAAASGASFLGPGDLGASRIAAPIVSLREAPVELPASPGSCGWDDEGSPCRGQTLIAQGLVAGFLSSRAAAAVIEEAAPCGSMRAASWRNEPLVQPGSLVLEPGAGGTLDELVADTRAGLLVHGCRGLVVDPLGLTFRFLGGHAWEIRQGRRTRLLRSPVLRGATPAFWARCHALAGPAALRLVGVCGLAKGSPPQQCRTGVLLPPACFGPVELLGGWS